MFWVVVECSGLFFWAVVLCYGSSVLYSGLWLGLGLG